MAELGKIEVARIAVPRVHAVDTAKGFAILFVVFGHAWRGSFGAGLIPDEGLFRLVDALIYAWHMPFFFFLSGLHFLDVVARKQPGAFVTERLSRLLWPMMLWTWIFFAVRFAAGGAANTPVTLSDFPVIPVPPYEHLWFLWALLLMQLALMVVLKPLLSSFGAVALRCGLAVCAVILAVSLSYVVVTSELIAPAYAHLPFFLAGVAFAQLARRGSPPWAVIAALLGIAVLLFGVTQGWPNGPTSLALVLLIWAVIAGLDLGTSKPAPWIAVLRYLGHASMAIYLAHTIFSAAFRIALLKVGVTSLPLHLLLAVAVGVIGPLVLLRVAQKLRVKTLLGL